MAVFMPLEIVDRRLRSWGWGLFAACLVGFGLYAMAIVILVSTWQLR
jgi:hypothetical protein